MNRNILLFSTGIVRKKRIPLMAVLSIFILTGCSDDGGLGRSVILILTSTVTRVSEIRDGNGNPVTAVTKGIPLQLSAQVNWSDGTTTNDISWSLSGAAPSGPVSGTTLSSAGLLAVDLSETAASVTVRAAYTGDPSVYKEKTLAVTDPVSPPSGAGNKTAYTDTVGGVGFTMVYVPGGHTFPTGINDDGTPTVRGAYEIGETEVTYELWYAVRNWAEDKGYTFSDNTGQEGSSAASENTLPGANKQEPVTMVSWYDAVVWLNALTEWVNEQSGKSLTPVYYYDRACTTVAKDSTDTTNFEKEDELYTYASAYAKPNTTGFRLPSSDEWELAARWRNDSANTVSGYRDPYFTKGDSASGATAGYDDADADAFAATTRAVAWYGANSSGKTQAVKGKTANALGLYDMSGNVEEWCDDWYPPGQAGSFRILRGGCWSNDAHTLRVGVVDYGHPVVRDNVIGFRPVRTAQ